MPNKLNFAEDLAKFAEFWKNPWAIALVLGVLVLYIPMAVWARRKDRLDEEKVM